MPATQLNIRTQKQNVCIMCCRAQKSPGEKARSRGCRTDNDCFAQRSASELVVQRANAALMTQLHLYARIRPSMAKCACLSSSGVVVNREEAASWQCMRSCRPESLQRKHGCGRYMEPEARKLLKVLRCFRTGARFGARLPKSLKVVLAPAGSVLADSAHSARWSSRPSTHVWMSCSVIVSRAWTHRARAASALPGLAGDGKVRAGRAGPSTSQLPDHRARPEQSYTYKVAGQGVRQGEFASSGVNRRAQGMALAASYAPCGMAEADRALHLYVCRCPGELTLVWHSASQTKSA